jgi:hypothetical protein
MENWLNVASYILAKVTSSLAYPFQSALLRWDLFLDRFWAEQSKLKLTKQYKFFS